MIVLLINGDLKQLENTDMFVTTEQCEMLKSYYTPDTDGSPWLDAGMMDIIQSLYDMEGLAVTNHCECEQYHINPITRPTGTSILYFTFVVCDIEALNFVYDMYLYAFDCGYKVSLTMNRDTWPDDCTTEWEDDFYPSITLMFNYPTALPGRANINKQQHVELLQDAIDDIVSDKIYFANKAKGLV